MYMCTCAAYCQILCGTGTTYDVTKETTQAREKKQNRLKKIEEAKKREKGTMSC